MKKVVLILDHKDRDLRGIALIAFWLNFKYGIFPIITTPKNELSPLVHYKPDLILFHHLRRDRHKELLEYAKRQGTSVAVLPAEGFPTYPDRILKMIGPEKFYPYINLLLVWGEKLIESVKVHPALQSATLRAVGSPRFDYHTSRFSQFNLTRHAFLERLGIVSGTPVISWISSTKYANPPEGIEAFIQKVKNPSFSDHRISDTVSSKARDHQKVFDRASSFINKLAHDFPKCVILAKPHPGENHEAFMRTFQDHANIRILGSELSITDLIRHSDIQLNWRCTTSAEAWLMDIRKKVISIEAPGQELEEFCYLSEGNEIVHEYAELKSLVSAYLAGTEVAPGILAKRERFIRDYLCAADGQSAERCADAIHEHLHGRPAPKRRFYHWTFLAKHLRSFRFGSRCWLEHRRRLDHSKYIAPSLVTSEIQNCEEAMGKKVNYATLL